MKVINRFAIIMPILALGGCAALDQVATDVQKATAPVALTESLPQICQAAKNNREQANSAYVGKGLVATGEVRSVQESFQPHYRVLLRSGQVAIHAGTENKASVTSLVVGKSARVSGVVTDVSYDYSGCSISLKDATF
jgi:outer membrane murein-binding lipoprotein Lpp